MTKFNVGDRVSVIGFDSRGIYRNQSKGTVENTGWQLLEQITVRWDVKDISTRLNPNVLESVVSIRQCRRLKKKERRRIWFERNQHDEGYSNVDTIWSTVKKGDRVEFVEVKKKRGGQ